MADKNELADVHRNEIRVLGDSHKKKRLYSKPSLIKYGQLSMITTGGSGNANEGTGADPNKWRP
jgi:hypothetical protein